MKATTGEDSRRVAGVTVGAAAPPLDQLEIDLAQRGGLEVGDEPMVLGFLASGDALFSSEAQREAIRAQLRGLGAFLLALSPQALWCFRPDDETQVLKSVAELPAGALATAFRNYGVSTSAASGPGLLALFVLDSQRTLRFAHVSGPEQGMTLEDAVARAASRLLTPTVVPVTPTVVPAAGRAGASRREFLVMTLIAGFAAAAADGCARPAPSRNAGAILREEVDVSLNVNGHLHRLRLEPRVSLLDALREDLRLTGTKKGCDHGQCGACTVLVDGRRINACLTLAVMAEGAAITTIEGLATREALHPLQAAFIAEDALQCGYCTPGQIMSAVGLLAEGQAHDADDVRELMSGNLCRCGAYPNIVTAIRRVQKEKVPG